MTYFFLDANVLLHFVSFDHIDWASVIERKDGVTIVFAPTFIEEIDKHKYNQTKKVVKKEPRRCFYRLKRLLRAPQSSKYPLLENIHFLGRTSPDMESTRSDCVEIDQIDLRIDS